MSERSDESSLLALIVRLEQRVTDLEQTVEMMLSEPDEDEVRFYMDGTPIN